VRFHEGLSLETTRLRFFGIHPHLTKSEVDRFTQVDHQEREGLVVLDSQDIIGVGRYDRSPGGTDAEVAFVVADSWQGLGIATILLAELVRRARPQGIDHFVADTLSENHHMQDVLRHSGLIASSTWDCGVVHVVLDLASREPSWPLTSPTAAWRLRSNSAPAWS
jgi:GNAT superfamily N-acetyltransferase